MVLPSQISGETTVKQNVVILWCNQFLSSIRSFPHIIFALLLFALSTIKYLISVSRRLKKFWNLAEKSRLLWEGRVFTF